jgi:adenylate cyclase
LRRLVRWTKSRGGSWKRRIGLSLLLGTITGLVGLALHPTTIGISFERTYGLDWLFALRGPVSPPPNITVIGINGRTGGLLGLPKLPRDWPRSIHAQLLDELVRRNAALVVFDIDFSRPKDPDADKAFAKALTSSNRAILFEPLTGRRERVLGADGGNGGWTWVEEKHSPAEVLAAASKAVGPFPLPKLGQTVTQFWAFKSSAGDAPTTVAIALQLRALAAYDEWLKALNAAEAPSLTTLPATPSEWTGPERVRNAMITLRRAFQEQPLLWPNIALRLPRPDEDREDGARQVLLALGALYAGNESRFVNFYGPPGTIPTASYESFFGKGSSLSQTDTDDLTDHVVFVGYSDLFDPDQPDRFIPVLRARMESTSAVWR